MNLSDLKRNAYMLRVPMQNVVTCAGGIPSRAFVPRRRKPAFFVEYSILNPALGTSQPILGQHPYYKRHGPKPSYLCIKSRCIPMSREIAGSNFGHIIP